MVTRLAVVPNCCKTVNREASLLFLLPTDGYKTSSSHFMLHTGIPAPLGQNGGLSEFNSQPNGVTDNLLETLDLLSLMMPVVFSITTGAAVLGQCCGQMLHIPKWRQPQQRGDPGVHRHTHVLLPDDAKRELKVGTLLLWMAEHKSLFYNFILTPTV